MMMAHTDIRSGDWIERLPPSWQPYARLARLDRPVGVWLLLWPAFWALALVRADLTFYLLFTIGAVVMRAAGCVINDMWDRELDAQVERTKLRPLASGVLSLKQAGVFLLALLLVGLVILLQFPPLAIGLGAASLVLIILYPLMKRVTWWPQAFLGLTFNWGVLMGAAVVGFLPLWAWPLYAAGVLWTLGYDTIYAHQDREDDALAGIKSTARMFAGQSKFWVGGFYAGCVLLILLAGMVAQVGWGFYGMMILAAAHLVWQVQGWQMNNPADCLRRFRANRDFGLLVFLAMLAGAVVL